MLIDLSIKITKAASKDAFENEKIVAFGYLGTHTDFMTISYSKKPA